MNNWFHRLGQDERIQHRVTIGFAAVLAVLVIVLVIVLFIPAQKKSSNSDGSAADSTDTSSQFSEESGTETPSVPSGETEAEAPSASPGKDTGASKRESSAFSEKSNADKSSESDSESEPDSESDSDSKSKQDTKSDSDRSISVIGMVDSLGITVRDVAHGMGEIAAETASEPYRDKPDIDITSWEYILANPWNDIGDYTPALATLEGQQFDERIIDAMKAFVQGARDEGLSVVLSSGYRSYETQTYLFNRKAAQYGEEVAATIVAKPGTSEHQTGLCCDITDQYYEMKDESLENTALYQWMSKHCQEYGFIVRFPKGKQDITGIIYEPWHFRYVGTEAAAYIMKNGLTLEEFLDLYR